MYWERDPSIEIPTRTPHSYICLFRFSSLIQDPSCMLPTDQGTDDIFSPAAILFTMATCHSLKLVSDEIIGDPLDVKMFEFTRWTFEEGGHVYEFMRDQDYKESTEEVGLLDKDEPPRGRYVARDGSNRTGIPAVRPPASEGRVCLI